MSKLLPPNSTDFEKNVVEVTAKNTALPVQIRTLSSIDTAPDQFLSFLAWQYSVDSWDTDWQPSIQRTLIKKSFRQHQIKGTITAIREVLNQFGYTAKFVEWWQTSPQGTPGTFTLELTLNGLEMSESVYQELNRLIADAKPVSRYLTNLTININPYCQPRIACAVHCGDYITVGA